MTFYKGTQRYTIGIKPNSNNIQPLTVTKDGTYNAPAGVDGYNPVTFQANNTFIAMGSHTDSNGIWHRPEEWDDIESIDLGDRQEIYILYACHKTTNDWCRIQVSGTGTLSWSYGHVSNGIYTLHQDSTETTISNNSYAILYLSNIQDDYIVIRIKSTANLYYCKFADWVATSDLNYAMPFRCQSALMRYGRLPKGTSLQNSSTYYLESDDIIDFAKDHWNTTQTISVSNAYDGSHQLQRWRYTGWDLAKNKITSFASMFGNCELLCDVPDPLNLDNWVTSNTTAINNMFYYCYSMNTNITVYNWNLSNLTRMDNLFYLAKSIKTIKGTETWSSAPKCTNISAAFYNCYLLSNEIDLSNCYFGNGTANLTSIGNLFYNTYGCQKINISNTNFSKVTSMAGLFTNISACKQVIMSNITPPTSLSTSYNNIFSSTAIEEMIIDGWDFSGSGVNTGQGFCNGSYGLKKLIFRNCIAPSTTINDTSAQFNISSCYNLEYLDISFLDMSVFSNTSTHTTSFRYLYKLVDFYPPQNISKNFNLTNDYSLSHNSLIRVINNLKTVSTTQTLTIGAYNIAKLSAAEQAVATGKGWTLA